MYETRTKKWEKEVLEKGIEKGIEKIAANMIKNGESNEKIALYTGLSAEQIEKIREHIEKDGK